MTPRAGSGLPRKRRSLALLALVAACLAGAGQAVAATVKMSVAINPGTLSLSLGQVRTVELTLDGSDSTPTVTLPLRVTDSTGSGDGWHLTVTSTRLTTGGTSPRSLPADATTVSAVSVACAGGSCVTPANGVDYPFVLPAADTPPSPVRLLAAGTGTGLGSFTVNVTLRISVPATSLAGDYAASVTLAAVSGP